VASTTGDARALASWRYFTLGYLFFVYLPFWFSPVFLPRPFWASVAATAVFLPIYLVGFHARGPWRLAAPAAIAAIGLALMPLNPAGNTFIIYAMMLAAYALRPRAALAAAACFGLLLAAELEWLGEHRAHLAIALLVGGVAVSSALLGRIAERGNAELRLSQEEVRRLAQRAERERIGRDLHDLLGRTLSLVALKSELAGRLVERDAAAARGEIADVEKVAREALGQVRRAVVGIRAAGLEAELVQARLALATSGVALHRRGELDGAVLPPDAETALALGLREAITNVLRHARAETVEVELATADQGALLTVVDDGRGGAVVPGEGLSGMRERLAAVGGTLTIAAGARGGGTRLSLRVPL
jgi:two-component system sensor histidine kinase DesK